MASPQRILIIKLADLGDLLLTEPALRSLRAGHPEAQIDILTSEPAAHLARIIAPWASIITLPQGNRSHAETMTALVKTGAKLATTRYDLAIFLHHLTTERGAKRQRMLASTIRATKSIGLDNGRGKHLTERVPDPGFGIRHETELFVDVALAAGGRPVDPIPRIAPTGERSPIQQPYAVIAPTTGPYAPVREWSPERFGEAAQWIQASLGFQPVIIGTASANRTADDIQAIAPTSLDLTGQTSLSELINIISHANLVVSNDSLPAHLASALDCPSITIFGPSNITSWRPPRAQLFNPGDMSPTRHLIVSAVLPCSPCLYTGYRLGRRVGCPARTCLEMVSVEHVKRAIERVVGESA